MGTHILKNTEKLKKCSHSPGEQVYTKWVMAELHTEMNKKNGYKNYTDDSAFMANLWLAWTMEFFLLMFDLLITKETQPAASDAYQKTLKNHHNWFQQTAFTQAVKQLPPKPKLLSMLQGEASKTAVDQDLAEFVKTLRPVVQLCLQLQEKCDKAMADQRNKGSS